MKTSGAKIIADKILSEGLKQVFVYPGGTIAPTLDALMKRGVKFFCSRHEQGAGYAALAIGRLTQKPQVSMVTSGPGVTNIITVIADAFFDSTPLIVITGQIASASLKGSRLVRQRGFQEVDTVSLMKPITKAVFLVRETAELPKVLNQAFSLATEGRPGPVVIDLPMDVQRNKIDHISSFKESNPKRLTPINNKDIDKIASLIARSKKPLILAGQGVILSNATSELRNLINIYKIPVVTSLLGIGAVPTQSSLSLGYIGHTGMLLANKTVHDCDLLLVIGSRLDIRQTGTETSNFVPNGKIARIDIDKNELDNCPIDCDIKILSDAKNALKALLNKLRKINVPIKNEWLAHLQQWKNDYPLIYEKSHRFLKPQSVIEEVNRQTKGKDVIVTTGVGSHQQWTARHFDFDFPKRTFLTSGGHGAMGYDLPSAMGAQLLYPNKKVICFVGDGSIQMNIQELMTIILYKLPVKIFVIDNRRLAMVSQFQKIVWKSDPTTGNKINPDFADIARSYGLKGLKVQKPSELKGIVSRALNEKGPVLVHCIVDSKEDVVPMLLAGQTMNKMWPFN